MVIKPYLYTQILRPYNVKLCVPVDKKKIIAIIIYKKLTTLLLNIIIISNAMCYTILCMLEWMRKGKYRVGTLRTQELRGLALTAYIHEGIP